jgi:hypothetical protein
MEVPTMLRALFLGLGLFTLFVGLESLAVDSATLTNLSDNGPALITVAPPEWAPWSLISFGAITILYSFTLPQKFSGG